MRIIICLILSFHAISFVCCQESTDFGIEITPKFVSQISDNSDLLKSSKNLGFTMAGAVFFPIGEKYQIKTGISLSNFTLDQKDYSLGQWPNFPNNSWFEESFDYVSLGLFIQNHIYFTKAQTSFYINPGLEFLIHLSNDGTYKDYFDGVFDPTLVTEYWFDGLRSYDILCVFGLGVEFELANQWAIFIEPKVEYGLTQIRHASSRSLIPPNSRFFNLGLTTGVRF